MKNIALITAGGVGSRANQFIPKQFLTINDKPVIIYTLEKFQQHEDISDIVVVCLAGWEEYLKANAKQFGISKLRGVVNGGQSGIESIQNGLKFIREFADLDDVILVHDGNRPGVSVETISDCILQTQEQGVSITAININEAVFTTENDKNEPELLNRDLLIRTQTPHGIVLDKLIDLFKLASEKNITQTVAICTLLVELNQPIYFCKGSAKNFKITTAEDIDLFKGMILVDGKK